MQATTPTQAWRALRDGNARFTAGRREHPNQDADRRADLAERGQHPFAVVFGCSDSRVAAEIIFDRGLGDLFVVRTAGHVVDSGVLGSIEFGVTMLNTPLVVVLGHDRCGAVIATLTAHATGQMPGGYVRDIVERVTPSLITARPVTDMLEHGQVEEEVGDEHIVHTVHLIGERSAAIAQRVQQGRCAVVGVGYRLGEGKTRLVSALGDVGEQPDRHNRVRGGESAR